MSLKLQPETPTSSAAAPTTDIPSLTPRRTPSRVAAVCTLAGLAGVLTAVAAVALARSPWDHLPLALVLGAGAAILQIVPVRISHDGEGENLYLEEAFLVAMAVYLTVPEAVLGLVGAVAVGQAWRWRGWTKAVFNMGEMTVAATAGVTVAHLLGAGAGDVSGAGLVAACVGVLVFSLLSMLAVAGIINFVQGTSLRTAILDGLDVRAAVWVTSLAVGVMIAIVIEERPWMLPVSMLPIAMLQLTYSRSFRQYRHRRQIEKLYHATAAIPATIDPKRVREQLIGAAHAVLDAGTVRLVPAAEPAQPGELRAPLDRSTAIQLSGRVGGGAWDDDDAVLLQALASVASNALSNATLFEQVRTITGSLGEGVVALDQDGRIDFVNPAVEVILGWESDELLGRRPHEMLHAHEAGHREVECALVAPAITGIEDKNTDGLFSRKDGTVLPVAYTTSPVVRDGQLVGAVIAFHDISERKTFEQRLKHQAFHDMLTGLPNRSLFMDRLEHAQARTARTRALHALLFIDLDRFKIVNDSLGHHVGDELLVQVASRLRRSIRSGDTLARFGGDEFVALLEDLVEEGDAITIAERILTDMRAPFSVAGRDLSVSCSIGVVVGDGSRQDPDECLREGDVAMYRAKARGKACFEVFHHDADPGQLRRLDLEIELRGALDRGELDLDYQPVVSARTGAITGIEALLRWRHPVRGLISPAEFIPLAEETGLILTLGQWVLEQACQQAMLWQKRFPDSADFVISVNLSPRQFRQPDLAERVASVLARTGLAARRLCVEVTEGVMVDDVESATETLHRLRELGVAVSIDDFGTGYSSLSYLKRFPIDYVKIDRSFIRGLGHETVDSEIVRSVIRLAGAIGIAAVAEGVENEAQLVELRSLGCPLVQGYHISRPQPAADIEALLRGAPLLTA